MQIDKNRHNRMKTTNKIMERYKKKQSGKNMYTNNPKWSHKEM